MLLMLGEQRTPSPYLNTVVGVFGELKTEVHPRRLLIKRDLPKKNGIAQEMCARLLQTRVKEWVVPRSSVNSSVVV